MSGVGGYHCTLRHLSSVNTVLPNLYARCNYGLADSVLVENKQWPLTNEHRFMDIYMRLNSFSCELSPLVGEN